MRVRFSIAGLMAAVLLLALGFAGLRAATALWASALFTLTVTVLAAAVLGAAVGRGRPRVACLGFAVFCGTYLLTTFALWPGTNGVSVPPILTKALLDYAQPPASTPAVMTLDPGPQGEMMKAEALMVPTLPAGASSGTVPTMMAPFTPYTGRVVNMLHYRRIGHLIAAIGFGLLGALLGNLFAALSEAREEGRPDRGRSAEQ
jgi:hypothetical protein